MALPPIWLKATLVINSPQKDHFYNVFYYVPSAAPSFTGAPMTDATTLCDAALSQLTANLPPVLTDSTNIVGMNLELQDAGNVYTVSRFNATPGTISGDELPDFNAVIIQKRTATAGKSGRGRWFLGPVPEAATDENYRLNAMTALYANVASDWVNPFTSLGTAWNPQLYSKKNNSFMPLTSTFVDPKLGSIGGRKSHSLL